jgi:hypothetical protein
MKTLVQTLLVAAAAGLAGCAATNQPLMFGDETSFGLHLGDDVTKTGGSVSLGYKAQSGAIVPVSSIDGFGNVRLLKGYYSEGEDTVVRDAMSVFASFESLFSDVGSDPNALRLGQVFSTGLAAQSVTMGYRCRDSGGDSCDVEAKVAFAAEQAASAAKTAFDSRNAETGSTTLERDLPMQMPLVFMRSDVLGLDMGGTGTQDGIAFTLGFSNRNLALIPTNARGPKGKLVSIAGDNQHGGAKQLDTLSVMGQFRVSTNTKAFNLDLGRYFATGVAARNLGIGVGSRVAKEGAAPASAAQEAPEAAQAVHASAAVATR